MPISDTELLSIVNAEVSDALEYRDEIGERREVLMDYYHSRPLGDEVDGRSQFVTSDVSDVVEWMLPSMLRVLTQGRHVWTFESDTVEGEDEARQKTEGTNYVFLRKNDGVLILHDMLKDGLLQYTGVVKVSWREETRVTTERYKGLSSEERAALEADEELELEDGEDGRIVATRRSTKGKICYDNVPADEFVISRSARDFNMPRLIGFRTDSKTRSDLIAMGFDADVVNSLPRSSGTPTEESVRRNPEGETDNPGNHKPNDPIDFGEYYLHVDVDEDGIAELYQIFWAGNRILEKEPFDEHPFAVITPVPMPHRAIGTCPADQAADIQLVNSVLTRNLLDNIYTTNYNRIAYNDRVDMDDLFTPRPGGGIHVEGDEDIGGALQPIPIAPQTDGILQALEHMMAARETRTGVNRHNQGMDADSLNKTATGFRGMMDASQQRMELILRICANTGVRELGRKTANLLTKYQDEAMQIRVTGGVMEVDPTLWRHDLDCEVRVGLGAGDRNEKILNVGRMIDAQMQFMEKGLPLTDSAKVYNALEQLVVELGLKDASRYFNDPTKPDELLQFQNEMMERMINVAQEQINASNPLAEAEQVKAQARLVEQQSKEQLDLMKFVLQLAQDDEQFRQNLAKELTQLELEYVRNVPGALI